jgi:hypothetical protein
VRNQGAGIGDIELHIGSAPSGANLLGRASPATRRPNRTERLELDVHADYRTAGRPRRVDGSVPPNARQACAIRVVAAAHVMRPNSKTPFVAPNEVRMLLGNPNIVNSCCLLTSPRRAGLAWMQAIMARGAAVLGMFRCGFGRWLGR